MRKNNNPAISLALLALALDIIMFILASIALFKVTGVLLTLVLAIFLYLLAYDIYEASSFIIKYFIQK